MITGMDWDWFNRDGWLQLILVISLAFVGVLLEIALVACLFFYLGWRP